MFYIFLHRPGAGSMTNDNKCPGGGGGGGGKG